MRNSTTFLVTLLLLPVWGVAFAAAVVVGAWGAGWTLGVRFQQWMLRE